jgi:integrase
MLEFRHGKSFPGVRRRTLEDIKRKLSPSQIYSLIAGKTWPYKTQPDFYHARDRALMSLLYLTCGRITEVLSLKKSQFMLDMDPDFVIITDMIVVKRKKKARKTMPIRDEVPLPKRGPLAKFTKLVLDYLAMLEGEDVKLFMFGRRRAWQIVRYVTGYWCHFFRSQGESYYGKLFRNIFALKDFVMVTDAKTLSQYVKTDWREYRDRLLGR